jgi:hypothetical protein
MASYEYRFSSEYIRHINKYRCRLFVPEQHGYGQWWCVPRIIVANGELLLAMTGNIDSGLD